MNPSPELFPGLAGNRHLKEKLAPAVLQTPPALSHAYIIEGPEGSGKHTLAIQLAAALSCEQRQKRPARLPCGECLACRKIFRNISPDVITLTREGDKASIGVDQIRELRTDVHIYPNELENKIYIIEDADKMTPQAQNAFLLTLEEPPAYALIFLLCENSASLLETVRSRAQTLRLRPLSMEENRQTVLRISPEAAQTERTNPVLFASAISGSRGCPGKAVSLLSSGEGAAIAERRELILRFLSLAADRRSGARAMQELVGACRQSRDTTAAVLADLSDALRDLILLKKSEKAELLFFTDPQKAADFSDSFPIKRLISLSEAVQKAAADTDRYLNVRLTLMNMLADAGII